MRNWNYTNETYELASCCRTIRLECCCYCIYISVSIWLLHNYKHSAHSLVCWYKFMLKSTCCCFFPIWCLRFLVYKSPKFMTECIFRQFSLGSLIAFHISSSTVVVRPCKHTSVSVCTIYLHCIPLIFYNLFILHIYGDKVNISSFEYTVRLSLSVCLCVWFSADVIRIVPCVCVTFKTMLNVAIITRQHFENKTVIFIWIIEIKSEYMEFSTVNRFNGCRSHKVNKFEILNWKSRLIICFGGYRRQPNRHSETEAQNDRETKNNNRMTEAPLFHPSTVQSHTVCVYHSNQFEPIQSIYIYSVLYPWWRRLRSYRLVRWLYILIMDFICSRSISGFE